MRANIGRLVTAGFLLALLAGLLAGCGSDAPKQLILETQSISQQESTWETEVLPEAVFSQTETTEPLPIAVYVCGEVVHPGLYYGDSSMRLWDFLNMAGGPLEDAVLEGLPLARFALDQETLRIPALSESAAEGDDAPDGDRSDGRQDPVHQDGDNRINLNTAGEKELCELPGIGPVRAKAILDYRKSHGPFASAEELLQVPGIKAATFRGLQDRVCVR